MRLLKGLKRLKKARRERNRDACFSPIVDGETALWKGRWGFDGDELNVSFRQICMK